METLIYIVLGIIFFIYQIFKESRKLKDKARTQRPEMNPPQDPEHKSIDDRYRERREKQLEAERRMEERAKSSERPIGQDRSKREEWTPKSLEDIKRGFSERERKREEAVQRNKPGSSLEEIVDEENVAMEKVRRDKKALEALNEQVSRELQESKERTNKAKKAENPYAAFLKNPQTVKTAFIASEIFKRKF